MTEEIEKIDALYETYLNTESDIKGHLPVLKQFAQEHEHITEFGVRTGKSTIAFLSGRPKVMRSYDIDEWNYQKFGLDINNINTTDFKFIRKNVLGVEIDKTEVLFIDTDHGFKHTLDELKMHHSYVSKYIILHDTEPHLMTDGTYLRVEILKAIAHFLSKHHTWGYDKIYSNDCGLTILKRIKDEE